MSPESPQEGIQAALVAIGEGIARLRAAAGGVHPVSSRHIMLQAVGRLERTFGEVVGLLEPVDAA